MKTKRISVDLTREQWLTILRAVDNGCGAGDTEVLHCLFDTYAKRKRFSTAFAAINKAIGAGYVVPSGDDLKASAL